MTGATRTFIAVALDESLKAALRRLIGRLQVAQPEVRWIDPAQMHLTLAFLGDVPDADLPLVIENVAEAAKRHQALSLTVAGLGAFPSPGRARVVWTGLEGEALPGLLALQRDVASAVAAAGYPAAGGDAFAPHITLGRVKGPRGRPGALDVNGIIDANRVWSGGQIEIEELIANASALARQGPAYSVLARAPLNATP